MTEWQQRKTSSFLYRMFTYTTVLVFFQPLWHQKHRAADEIQHRDAKAPIMSSHCRLKSRTNAQTHRGIHPDTLSHTLVYRVFEFLFPSTAGGWFIAEIKISDKGNRRYIKLNKKQFLLYQSLTKVEGTNRPEFSCSHMHAHCSWQTHAHRYDERTIRRMRD